MDIDTFIYVTVSVLPPLSATVFVFFVGWMVLWLADVIDDLEWL